MGDADRRGRHTQPRGTPKFPGKYPERARRGSISAVTQASGPCVTRYPCKWRRLADQRYAHGLEARVTIEVRSTRKFGHVQPRHFSTAVAIFISVWLNYCDVHPRCFC
jgi:hypothetical protein